MSLVGRVILIARRGSTERMELERALRSDDRYDLIRVRSRLEALGEVSRCAMDPSPPIVVVHGGPGASSGVDSAGLHGLSVGIRRVNPRARLVHIDGESDDRTGAIAMEASEAAALIGGLMAETDRDQGEPETTSGGAPRDADETSRTSRRPGDDARAAEEVGDIRSEAPDARSQAPDSSSEVPEAPAGPAMGEMPFERPLPEIEQQIVEQAEAQHEPSMEPALLAQAAGTGDIELVAILLRGDDLRSSAVKLAQRRLGGHATLEAPGEEPADASAVVWRGRDFGWLVAPGVDEAERRSAAGWLAGWLQLASQHAELRHAAFIDPLTGAYNRRFFDRFLPSAIEQARAGRSHVTLLVFDIDEFKKYNDQHGHGAGDEILTECVRLLRSVIRPTDRVCRIGGDEFAVIFSDPPREPGSRPPESVFDISRRFQQQVIDHHFPKLGNDAPGTLTVSGGLATFPWDASTAAGLLERADALALQSKRLGKNAIALGPGAELVCRRDRGR